MQAKVLSLCHLLQRRIPVAVIPVVVNFKLTKVPTVVLVGPESRTAHTMNVPLLWVTV